MDGVHREFFEDLARELDGWSVAAVDAVSRKEADLKWAGAAAASFELLRESLPSPTLVNAYKEALRVVLTGLLHSVMVSLDGGTQLADTVRLRVQTEDGVTLGPGLNELLFEHLHETGRLSGPGDSYRKPGG